MKKHLRFLFLLNYKIKIFSYVLFRQFSLIKNCIIFPLACSKQEKIYISGDKNDKKRDVKSAGKYSYI